MGANKAEVSSVALTGLQTDLTSLSNTLHEIYDLMNADMNQVKEFWQDPKYEEFRNGYSKQIKHCEDVSVRYSEWCKRILAPAIDKVVEIERADVGGDGGSVSTANVGSTPSTASSGMANKFNTTGKTVKQETTSCTEVEGSIFGNGGSTETCVTDRPDGTRTTKVTSCTTTGASASVGIAKGGITKKDCKTTTIDEKISGNISIN